MALCGWVGGGGWVGWVGVVGGYDQLCCPASPKLLLGLDLGIGCDNRVHTQLHCMPYLDPVYHISTSD